MLKAISPIDGRYADKTKSLKPYFSEWALMKYRIFVEVSYFLALSRFGVIPSIASAERRRLESLHKHLTPARAEEIKKLEKRTNHDVKAVEYYLKQQMRGTSLQDLTEFVHLGLTSEDVNNLAYSLAIADFFKQSYSKQLRAVQIKIAQLAKQNKALAMLAHTHGQPASPTTLGKEFAVYVHRLQQQNTFAKLPGKLNGAVGNYNALHAAYPKKNWIQFSKQFITRLGLEPNLVTTQIEPHDGLAALFQQVTRINNILVDLARDCWLYVSMDYFSLKAKGGEVGSSTMPHKVNPIDFENAEGNLELANSLFAHLADTLQKSRLQRDLSDSTTMRNIGVAFAHTMVAYQSLLQGLGKVKPNKAVIVQDLQDHPEVLAEAIQTILRREGIPQPYEKVKQLTRGKKVTMKDIHQFLDTLRVSDKVKRELKQLTPEKYVGLASRLVK